MIPISDINPRRRFPYVTVGLIIINVIIFLYEILNPNLNMLIYKWGVVPKRMFTLGGVEYLTLITSMFLHGSFAHIIGNMLYLWIFGDNIENFLGPAKFILFYFLSGILAGLIHSMIYASSMVPTIGASGAIAGIMGAYFYLYPNAKVLALVFLFFYITIIPVPAFIFLGIWFLMQLLPAFVSFGKLGTGIAFWAHVGGFVAGIVLIILMGGRRRRGYYNSYWRRW